MESQYNKMISVKVTPEQAEKLKKIAKSKQTSQGAIVRQWIEAEKISEPSK